MTFRVAVFTGLILLCLVGFAASQTAQAGAASPVYTGIIVDCSGSQRLQMDKVVNVIKQYVDAMQDGDQAFIVRYVDAGKITLAQDLTGEKSELIDTAEGLYVEGGQTAMSDAVEYAAKYFGKNKQSQTGGVLILISSGEDRNSARSIDDTIGALKEQQLRVFTIGISDLKVSTKLLDRLAKDTGGKAFVPRTVSDFSNTVLDITRSIRGVPANK